MSEVKQRQTETLEKTSARQLERSRRAATPADSLRELPWPAIVSVLAVAVIAIAVVVFLAVR